MTSTNRPATVSRRRALQASGAALAALAAPALVRAQTPKIRIGYWPIAAGLPLLPGTITYDEVASGEVDHVVLAGGEVAAMAIIDAVGRRLPGALGNEASLDQESFSDALGGGVEHPHFTRPAEFMGHGVPDVLVSGDHGAIARWRMAQVREPGD